MGAPGRRSACGCPTRTTPTRSSTPAATRSPSTSSVGCPPTTRSPMRWSWIEAAPATFAGGGAIFTIADPVTDRFLGSVELHTAGGPAPGGRMPGGAVGSRPRDRDERGADAGRLGNRQRRKAARTDPRHDQRAGAAGRDERRVRARRRTPRRQRGPGWSSAGCGGVGSAGHRSRRSDGPGAPGSAGWSTHRRRRHADATSGRRRRRHVRAGAVARGHGDDGGAVPADARAVPEALRRGAVPVASRLGGSVRHPGCHDARRSPASSPCTARASPGSSCSAMT